MYCTNCGKELEQGNFCSNCGNRVEGNGSGREVTLTITRKKKLMGWAVPFPIFVDNVEIGKLGNGKSITCKIEEGMHTVMFKCVEKKVEQSIAVNSNTNSVEVICQAKMGLAAAVAQILEVKYN